MSKALKNNRNCFCVKKNTNCFFFKTSEEMTIAIWHASIWRYSSSPGRQSFFHSSTFVVVCKTISAKINQRKVVHVVF